MSDDIDLDEYKIQLQQVETALAAEPDNEELKKLKADLEEVVSLSIDLLQASVPVTSELQHDEKKTDLFGSDAEQDSDDEFAESLSRPLKDWKVGERCLGKSSKDGHYHDAIIMQIADDQAVVQFEDPSFKNEINRLVQLRFPEPKVPLKSADDKKGSRKNKYQLDKEKRKKKALKKAQRMQELEEAKEQEKNKWRQFNTKAVAKQLKGVKKESIFASPESVQGRVGVGTCGRSGKIMTKGYAARGYVKNQDRGYR